MQSNAFILSVDEVGQMHTTRHDPPAYSKFRCTHGSRGCTWMLHMQHVWVKQRDLWYWVASLSELFAPSWIIILLTLDSEQPCFCSRRRHYLRLPRLFAWNKAQNKDGQCLCSQDMQKCERHMDNCLMKEKKRKDFIYIPKSVSYL